MSKNIVLCSDGTGQAGGQGFVSNVWRVFKAVDRHLDAQEQVAIHADGVGTEKNKYLRAVGGAFGWGLGKDIRLLYAALVRCYRDGDKIFLFGFSRGAFTVRSLAGMIHDIGILDGRQFQSDEDIDDAVESAYAAYRGNREKDQKGKKKENLENNYLIHDDRNINFIGVWDTVDAIGVPVDELRTVIYWISRFWLRPHLAELNPSIQNAYHAISIDDERHTFHPMVWDESRAAGKVQQIWFAGVHTNVGGGYPKDSLAFIPLDWIMKHAHECGLRFDPVKWKYYGSGDYTGGGGEYQTQADRNGRIYDSRRGAAVYYRYKPRMIGEIWEKAQSPKLTVKQSLICVFATLTNGVKKFTSNLKIFQKSSAETVGNSERTVVENSLPTIHESALMRIECGYTGYAPTAIPPEFRFAPTWKSNIESVGPGTPENDGIGQGPGLSKARNWIRWRRLLYFGLSVWTILFLVAGEILDKTSVNPCEGNRLCSELGWVGVKLTNMVVWILEFARYGLPDITYDWLDSYAAHADVFLLFIAILACMVVCKSWLKIKTDSAADQAWKAVDIKLREDKSGGETPGDGAS